MGTTEPPRKTLQYKRIDLDTRILTSEKPDTAFLDAHLHALVATIPREQGHEGDKPTYKEVYPESGTNRGDLARAWLMSLDGQMYSVTQSAFYLGQHYLIATTVVWTGIRSE